MTTKEVEWSRLTLVGSWQGQKIIESGWKLESVNIGCWAPNLEIFWLFDMYKYKLISNLNSVFYSSRKHQVRTQARMRRSIHLSSFHGSLIVWEKKRFHINERASTETHKERFAGELTKCKSKWFTEGNQHEWSKSTSEQEGVSHRLNLQQWRVT